MNFDKLLYDEIKDEFGRLQGIEVGTDEYKTTVDGLTKLVDRAIDIEKIDIETEDRNKKREEAKAQAEFEKELKLREEQAAKEKAEFEKELKLREEKAAREAAEFERKTKLREIEEEKRDRLIKNCISVVGILLPIGVTIWGTLKSLKFEEEGTVTTIMGRGFINKLLPKK
jgi:uncharacterized membrane protein YdbT with pleckstrin-like domain